MAFLSGGAFFAGVAAVAESSDFSTFAVGDFLAATGFEDLATGFDFSCSGAGVEMIFFAAMASSWKCG